MSEVYEVVGHLDRAVRPSVALEDDTILVDDGGDDLIIARPQEGDDDV